MIIVIFVKLLYHILLSLSLLFIIIRNSFFLYLFWPIKHDTKVTNKKKW